MEAHIRRVFRIPTTVNRVSICRLEHHHKEFQLQKKEESFTRERGIAAMESIQSRVESWIRDQRARFLRVSWGPLHWRFRWPPWNGEDADQRVKIRREYEKRKKQIHDLCLALKSESVEDLQDLLCCMVLSECVYKVDLISIIINL